MKKHLLIVLSILMLNIAGCKKTVSQPPQIGEIPGYGFAKEWQADLGIGKDPVKGIYLRDNTVVVYSSGNVGYWLAAASGEYLNTRQITSTGYTLYPPAALTNYFVIPTTASLEVYDKKGKFIESFSIPSVQGPAAGAGNSLYLGVSHSNSGRLARYDVTNKLSFGWEIFTAKGVAAAPAVFNDNIVVGGLDGKVFAINTARSPLWTMRDFAFVTGGPITADLAVDEFGVYVASQDQRLYCLDLLSGRIKWSFFASTPLTDAPVIIGNVVYQLVPGRGLVAINKTEGRTIREAMWEQPLARQVLSADEKFVYVRFGAGTIAALDKATGQPKFTNTRTDLVMFATNTKTPLVYAITQGGAVLAINPVTRPGVVREVASISSPLWEPLAVAQP